MIRHDNVFINMDITNSFTGLDILLHDLTDAGKLHLRGVEGAAPYNPSQNISAIFNANGDEVCTGRAVIVISQPIWLSFWQLHLTCS